MPNWLPSIESSTQENVMHARFRANMQNPESQIQIAMRDDKNPEIDVGGFMSLFRSVSPYIGVKSDKKRQTAVCQTSVKIPFRNWLNIFRSISPWWTAWWAVLILFDCHKISESRCPTWIYFPLCFSKHGIFLCSVLSGKGEESLCGPMPDRTRALTKKDMGWKGSGGLAYTRSQNGASFLFSRYGWTTFLFLCYFCQKRELIKFVAVQNIQVQINGFSCCGTVELYHQSGSLCDVRGDVHRQTLENGWECFSCTSREFVQSSPQNSSLFFPADSLIFCIVEIENVHQIVFNC